LFIILFNFRRQQRKQMAMHHFVKKYKANSFCSLLQLSSEAASFDAITSAQLHLIRNTIGTHPFEVESATGAARARLQ
jgi:hypothetical protein